VHKFIQALNKYNKFAKYKQIISKYPEKSVETGLGTYVAHEKSIDEFITPSF